MLLPAPTDPLLTQFGANFDNCNPSEGFNMDKEVSKEFHQIFFSIHNCNIPLLGGDIFVSTHRATTSFCTRKSDYNTTEGTCIKFSLVILPCSVNELLEIALSRMPNPPCNYTKLGLESFLVMSWADHDTQGPDGNLPNNTQMVIFMMPRTFEL